MKRAWELNRGDKALHGNEVLTYHKMDGAYAHWYNENNELRIGHSDFYRMGNDGIYEEVNITDSEKE